MVPFRFELDWLFLGSTGLDRTNELGHEASVNGLTQLETLATYIPLIREPAAQKAIRFQFADQNYNGALCLFRLELN